MQIITTTRFYEIDVFGETIIKEEPIETVILTPADRRLASRLKSRDELNAFDFNYGEGLESPKRMHAVANILYINDLGEIKILKSRYSKDHA